MLVRLRIAADRIELGHLCRNLDEEDESRGSRSEAQLGLLGEHACRCLAAVHDHLGDLRADSREGDRLAHVHRWLAVDEVASEVPDVATRQLLVLEGQLDPVECHVAHAHAAQEHRLPRGQTEGVGH
jgi:hypothetical protein